MVLLLLRSTRTRRRNGYENTTRPRERCRCSRSFCQHSAQRSRSVFPCTFKSIFLTVKISEEFCSGEFHIRRRRRRSSDLGWRVARLWLRTHEHTRAHARVSIRFIPFLYHVVCVRSSARATRLPAPFKSDFEFFQLGLFGSRFLYEVSRDDEARRAETRRGSITLDHPRIRL